MKRRLSLSLCTCALLTATLNAALAQTGLTYVAVEPCRIADTRQGRGVIASDTIRNFQVSGTAGELSVQGGTFNCPSPRSEEPAAVALYMIATVSPNTGSGNLFAFPSDATPGPGSTVNFRADGNIGNTSIVSLCTSDSCPADGPLSIKANFSERHVVLDVQGYFYESAVSTTANLAPAFTSVYRGRSARAEVNALEDYSFNPSGGQVIASRNVETGEYTVAFEGLASYEYYNLQITPYGHGGRICEWTGSNASETDLSFDVGCYRLDGEPAGSNFHVLITPVPAISEAPQ